ncbi:MAG: lysylphosphatidylglycerol synthase transmembrane domain-containing protein [Gemmatimonadota bacterium]
MRLDLRAILGIALSAALLWLTLRDVAFADVAARLRGSDPLLWALCTITATAIFPLRARRWQAILAPLGPRVPFAPLWEATAIGMMVNNVVPARAGEFARALSLTQRHPTLGLGAPLGSLVVDRLFDGTMVLTLLLLATLDPAFPAEATVFGWRAGEIGLAAAAVLGVVLLGLLLLLLAPELVTGLIDQTVGRLAPPLATRLRTLIESFAAGIAVLRSPALVGEVAWWTLLHWLTNALAFWLGFRALGIDAPFSAALFLQGVIAIGVSIPQAPGFFGVFEATGKAGLALYAVAAEPAVTWALGFHLLSFVPITALGAWYLARQPWSLRDLIGRARSGT